jgi:predicted nucleic acid-binding protein
VDGRSDLLISELTLTEVTSVLGRRCREAADYSSAAVVWRKMLEQARLGNLGIVDLVPAVHREAERLLLRPDSPRLRAADALHLALARSGGAAVFACYDLRLRAAASSLGLHLYPPPGS